MKESIKRLTFSKKTNTIIWCWIFLLPMLILYCLFIGYPILSSFWYSIIKWSGLTADYKVVGLANYKELFSDSLFWNALKNSFEYSFLSVPLQLSVSLLLAYTLNNHLLKYRGVYRTMYFLPVITTTSTVGIVMIFIWGVQGPVNALLLNTGIMSKGINFLGNGKTAMITVVLISVWKRCGIYMIYWLAGLQSIPQELYEASYIDGANRIETFFHVVLPQLAPIGGIIAVLSMINSLKIFDIVKTMTEGGPFYRTDVVATYVYRMAFSSEVGLPRLGYASAGAVLFGIIIILFGVILNAIKSKLQNVN